MSNVLKSSLVIPGEDKHAGISEKSVEDLLEIRNDYKESVPQATIKRKIHREHEVSKRKLENVFVEEKQPIMQMKPTFSTIQRFFVLTLSSSRN